jgi:hypothetical protein
MTTIYSIYGVKVSSSVLLPNRVNKANELDNETIDEMCEYINGYLKDINDVIECHPLPDLNERGNFIVGIILSEEEDRVPEFKTFLENRGKFLLAEGTGDCKVYRITYGGGCYLEE